MDKHFLFLREYVARCKVVISIRQGPWWLNELGSWISQQLVQAYHQYGVGSRPAL